MQFTMDELRIHVKMQDETILRFKTALDNIECISRDNVTVHRQTYSASDLKPAIE